MFKTFSGLSQEFLRNFSGLSQDIKSLALIALALLSLKHCHLPYKVHIVIWGLGGVAPGHEDQLGVAVHVVVVLHPALPGEEGGLPGRGGGAGLTGPAGSP